jgi:hypothetical protein
MSLRSTIGEGQASSIFLSISRAVSSIVGFVISVIIGLHFFHWLVIFVIRYVCRAGAIFAIVASRTFGAFLALCALLAIGAFFTEDALGAGYAIVAIETK